MRDRETIDSELRLLVAERRSIRERGGEPSSRYIDELLDERLGHRPAASTPRPLKRARSRSLPAPVRCATKPTRLRLSRRTGALRRFGPFAALPLSLVAIATLLVAIATVLMVLFVIRKPYPSAQPTEAPPSSARPESAAPAAPAAAAPPAPPLDIVDTALIEVLKHDGVPVPSHEYVVNHAHAVCDFLAQQPNFADAVSFVQRTSIWEGDQSSKFVAGAIVTYCPQYTPKSPDGTQQAFENAVSNLQGIQDDLQGISDDLQGIHDALPAIPGRP